MLLLLELFIPIVLLCIAYFRNRIMMNPSGDRYLLALVYCVQIVALFFTLRVEYDVVSAMNQSSFAFFYRHHITILICFFHIFFALDFAKKIISMKTLYALSMMLSFFAPSDILILGSVFIFSILFILVMSKGTSAQPKIGFLLTIFACLLLQTQLKYKVLADLVGVEVFIALLFLLFSIFTNKNEENTLLWALFLIIICRFMMPVNSYLGAAICIPFVIYYLVKIFANGLLDERKSTADLFFVLVPFDLLLGHTLYFVQTLFVLVIYKSFQMFKFDSRFNAIKSSLFCALACVVLAIGEELIDVKILSILVFLLKMSIILYFLLSERRQSKIEHAGVDQQFVFILVIPSLFFLFQYGIISFNPIFASLVIVAFLTKIILLYYPELWEKLNLTHIKRFKLYMKLRLEGK
ncbi:MAG: hypothetical protein HYV97_13610 [Bdellovibrio sp.]|nr:hypothetical protein [Bdellovibrio sp.]